MGRASAVVLVDREQRNTSAPTDSLLAAWNLQARYNSFNVTPISPHQFIGAAHTGLSAGGTVAYQSGFYGISSATPISGTDLILFTTPTTIPNYAPLYDASVDGSEIGKPMAVFGRGATRGVAIVAPIPPGPHATPPTRAASITLTGGTSAPTPTPSLPGNIRGWAFGELDNVQSWGRNVVDDVVTDDQYGELISFSFSAGPNRVADEAGVSVGDSGGGVFILSGGQWKLAGVNLGVDGPFSYTANGPYFNADIFDARGLYMDSPTNHFQLPNTDGPLEASNYSSRIGGTNLAAIRSLIGGVGSVGGPTVVPEPTSGVALMVVAVVASRCRR